MTAVKIDRMSFLDQLYRTFVIRMPVAALLIAMAALVAVEIFRDFPAWWSRSSSSLVEDASVSKPAEVEKPQKQTNQPDKTDEDMAPSKEGATGEASGPAPKHAPEPKSKPQRRPQIAEKEGPNLKITYTVFLQRSYKGFKVVTGREFSGGDHKTPKYEFCYAVVGSKNSYRQDNLTIAYARKGRKVHYSTLSAHEVQPFGVSVKEMEALARSHCHFGGKAGISDAPRTTRPKKSGERDA